MSTTPAEEEVPDAARRRSRWPGLVWAVPLAALIIVGYLAIQALARRGEVVTVAFDHAGEAQPGETKVFYQGTLAGQLIDIVADPDGRRLDFKLRMRPEAKPGLNTNARFWLIGATPSFDINSLKAVVEGVAIGYAPGEGGTPTRRFDGLDMAPQVLPGDHGTRYRLQARSLGPIRVGSALLFRGESIGKVTAVDFNGEAGFRLAVFVFEPYDALIKTNARFWKSSPLRLSFAGGGINANLAPASTILSGGIDLELPPGGESALSPAGSTFTLYSSENAARQGLSGPAVRFDFDFPAAAGDLREGAEVTLLGFPVGEVESARLAYETRTERPITKVTALLYPAQLDPSHPAPATPADAQRAATATLQRLIRSGYRARLRQTPALVGAQSIALLPVKGAARAELALDGANPRIPSAPGSADFEDIAAQADQILAKVNRLPIAAIGRNIEVVTDRLRRLAVSPQVTDGLTHLAAALKELDRSLAEVQPQIGPLMTKLNRAADEAAGIAASARQLLSGDGAAGDHSLPEAIGQLNQAARSIRALADYLNRHPEALIRGKRPEK